MKINTFLIGRQKKKGGSSSFSLICFYFTFLMGGALEGRNLDRVVGSSTLFPVLAAVSDQFYFRHLGIPPLIEPTGTGGGITLFCAGGSQTPLLVAASRAMSKAEKKYCHQQGIDPLEIDLGLDGIVLVTPQKKHAFNIRLNELRQALAYQEKRPITWSHLDPAYPSLSIKVLGPPSTAGTYEALTHLLSLKKLRQDGAFRTASDQETILLQKLLIEKDAFGIVSFGFMKKNEKYVFACPVEGVTPTPLTIRAQTYPLSRRLYLYVNRHKLKESPQVAAFLDFLVSSEVTGQGGLFERFGLIAYEPLYYKALARKWGQA